MSEATTLLQLQEIDLELLKHASTLSSMPQTKRLRSIDLAERKVRSELTGIVGQRKDVEMEVAETTAALEHYRKKTLEVQAAAESGEHTHREVRDIEQQLTSLAKHIEKAEYTLVPLRERQSRLELAERNARLTLQRLADERSATEGSLDEGSSALRKKIVELSRRRDEAAGSLSAEVLARYEAARKRFKGLGVEVLRGNVPSVCRVKIQPSSFHDLSRGPEIAECPYCHRLLITSEEGQS